MMAGEWDLPPVPPYKPRSREVKHVEIKSRDLSLIAVFASLYAALVYLFAPISFYALQFRIAGVLRPAIARKWILAVGYAIGVIIGNLFSPFAGPYELVFMPATSLLAGIIGYLVAKQFNYNYFIAGVVIATIISLSVSWMLNQLFDLPMLTTLPYLFISEQIVCVIGTSLFRLIEIRFKWW
jgi:uncharacterized membrane protein